MKLTDRELDDILAAVGLIRASLTTKRAATARMSTYSFGASNAALNRITGSSTYWKRIPITREHAVFAIGGSGMGLPISFTTPPYVG